MHFEKHVLREKDPATVKKYVGVEVLQRLGGEGVAKRAQPHGRGNLGPMQQKYSRRFAWVLRFFCVPAVLWI